MAKVFAPFFSLKAKGKFGGVIQVQPKPYSKDLVLKTAPEEVIIPKYITPNQSSPFSDLIFPFSMEMGRRCEMDRIMKVQFQLKGKAYMVDNPSAFGYDSERFDFEKHAREQQKIFRELKQLQRQLTEAQKTSWKVFGLTFIKQDLCTLAMIPCSWADMFMSFNLLVKLSAPFRTLNLLWAPVSVEMECRYGLYWYHAAKQAQLRRAWGLYRKNKYSLRKVMSITQAWKKHKAWYNEVTSSAWDFWKWVDSGAWKL